MDTITIRDLEVFYCVGVPDAERARPQRLLLTIQMQQDFRAAVAADELGNTIDYDALCRRLTGFGEAAHWKLIETLASDIAQMVLEEFRPPSVTVTVKKFVLPQTRYVAVEVTRSRS